MFQTSHISFGTSKALNPLVFDYIQQKEDIKNLSAFFPDKNGFEKAITSILYTDLDREKLISILNSQAKLVTNTSEKTNNNITLLKNKNSFTITTGHQLCLFTGPLYFIHKIFSAINLAEELNKLFPSSTFIPVYWMASEDHDFEEVNHFNVFGKNLKWESTQSGAVGNFKTKELESILSSFKDVIGTNENSNYLINLFGKSYLQHENLADATRFLVNELFGKYGLVVVDGNDTEFKQQCKTLFKKDIFENISVQQVTKTIEHLTNLNYKVQVNPRDINCFYIDSGLRGRIEKNGANYKVNGSNISFTETELEQLIEQTPEKISPNVVLRPVYQQQILPNIAYVGGPGEIAYWLQYKNMFDALNVNFPILVPRSFVTIIDKNTASKISKLGFKGEDIFKEENELINEFQEKNNNVFELEQEQAELIKLYNSIKEKISGVDKTLVNSVSAEEQKTVKSFEALVQKANKALKQRSETEINQVKQVKQKLFPNGIPQERIDNFSTLYANNGPDLFDVLKSAINPLDQRHILLTAQ